MNETMPSDFSELISSHDKPILVDFWADWCQPCHMVSPVVKQLAQDWKGRLTVIKVNTEEKPSLSQQYRINSLPTLILFKDGKEAHRVSGALPLGQMKSEFERFL